MTARHLRFRYTESLQTTGCPAGWVRNIGPVLAFVALVFILAGGAVAQTWPTKPVRLVVSQPPGGTMDLVARQVAERLRLSRGWNFVVENKPGANGIIATQGVARAAPDGYTLTLASGVTHTINPYLYPKVGYDAVADFQPIANLVNAPNVISVNGTLAPRNLLELLEMAKSRPGQLNYASAGTGGTGQLAMELLKSRAKVSITHIPYQGIAAAVQDTIAGRTQIVAFPPAALMAHFKAGSLRPLAVTSARRGPVLPDVPTVAELGFPGFEGDAWYGIMGPAGMPPEVVATLSTALKDLMADPALIESFGAQGLAAAYLGPQDFASYVASDAERWKNVIKLSGAKLE